ncbi:unnamed protein product [Blepharisma stoltei]|uniref:Alpha-and gamma-adaptin-binding protein p34 n=1 Tax=Blepharisma stoltei TaxID=1481888 RepID=A0AAU9IHF0_9CILI|nr:unnamed protein product [Blepharisma stoltei]
MEGFKVFLIVQNSEEGMRIIRHLKCEEANQNPAFLSFTNKYFTLDVNIYAKLYTDEEELTQPYAIILLDSELLKEWHNKNTQKIENSECSLLISNGENEDLENWAIENEIEYVYDNLDSFEGFKKEDGENIGLGRVREAIECAAAPYAKTEKPSEVKQEEREPTEEEIENDLDTFEYFLNKIREVREMAPNSTEEERKERAENTIKELMEKFKLDD